MSIDNKESVPAQVSSSIEERPAGGAGTSADPTPPSPQTDFPSKAPAPQAGHHANRRRLLAAALGALVVLAALVFGIPWVQQALNTVSTDDAYVNDHVTFVAPRVPGQVLRVLVDDNNR